MSRELNLSNVIFLFNILRVLFRLNPHVVHMRKAKTSARTCLPTLPKARPVQAPTGDRYRAEDGREALLADRSSDPRLTDHEAYCGFYLKFSFSGVSLPRVLVFLTVSPPFIGTQVSGRVSSPEAFIL